MTRMDRQTSQPPGRLMLPAAAADTNPVMIRDLRTILEGWEYEPGKISVRKIVGRDGREKIQTRIDLGVLQLECAGRPDGRRPHGFESLLDYHEHRLREHVAVYGDDEDFVLGPEDCDALRHEAYLYYQRYLSCFVLEEYAAVARDTARNLRLIDFCERYAARAADRRALRDQRCYVTMMLARALTYGALEEGRPDAALAAVDDGLARVRAAAGADESVAAREIDTLSHLRAEVLARLPADHPARLEHELREALRVEDYERAARLRDRLATHVRVAPHAPSPP